MLRVYKSVPPSSKNKNIEKYLWANCTDIFAVVAKKIIKIIYFS